MEPITYNIRLDASKNGSQAVLNAKKGDARTRRIVAHIYSGTTPFVLPEAGAVATLWAAKPDGTRIYKLADVSDGGIAVTLTSQMLAAVGRVSCELQVIGPDGEVLTSPRFDIEVEDTMSDDAPESTDEFTALTEALSRVANIEESEAARAEAETKREEAETGREKAEAAREEALAAAVDAAGDAVTDMIAEADADVSAAVENADAAAQRANAAAKRAEDVTAGAVGWDTIPDKPEVFPPSEHVHAIDEVTGLVDELIAKAPIESPVFTGKPKAPTASAADDTAQIATTEFVHEALLHDITGKRATGTAVTLDGVIPDTALTEFMVYGKSAQGAVPSPDVSIPTGNNLFRGIGVPDDEEGYYNVKSYTTASSDGYARFYCDNTNSDSNKYVFRAVNLAANASFRESHKYKILTEIRNNKNSVTLFGETNNSIGNAISIFPHVTLDLSKSATLYEVQAKDDFSESNVILRIGVTAPPGSICDFEARVSIYPADYDVKEYEPYQGGPVEIESAEVGNAEVWGSDAANKTAYPINLTLRGIPVDSGGNYTDANGQEWICDTYDAASGEYVKRVAELVFTGVEDWITAATITNGVFRNAIFVADKKGAKSSSDIDTLICNRYETVTGNDTFNMVKNGVSGPNKDSKYIAVYDTAYNTNDTSLWKSYLAELHAAGAPLTVVYTLAEPITIHLPPQYIRAFSPVTNAAAGGVDIAVEFNNVAGSARRSPLVIEAALTNTLEYPFNDSGTAVALPYPVNGYTVATEAEAESGFVGDIIVSDKTPDGFRIAHTGSAKNVKVKCFIQGGV